MDLTELSLPLFELQYVVDKRGIECLVMELYLSVYEQYPNYRTFVLHKSYEKMMDRKQEKSLQCVNDTIERLISGR
jgi:hypothetical protein